MGRHPRPPQPGGSHHWPPQQRHCRARPAPGGPEAPSAEGLGWGRAAGHDPGHPRLPGVRVDQGDRPGDGRADGGPFRHRHPGHHRTPAGPADRGARAGTQAGPEDRRRMGGAEGDQEVMVFLSGVGVSTSLAVRIYKKYVGAAISVVRNEPFRLASEVWGIGFKTADTIAAAVGIAHDSPQRIQAGLQYTLSQAADDGHCYLPEPNLIREAAKILDVGRELIGPCLDELAADEGVVREPVPASDDATGRTVPAVYLVPFHRAECSLAGGLLDLLHTRE